MTNQFVQIKHTWGTTVTRANLRGKKDTVSLCTACARQSDEDELGCDIASDVDQAAAGCGAVAVVLECPDFLPQPGVAQ